MRYYERRIHFGFGGGITPVVRNLLIANTAIFLIDQILGWTLGRARPLNDLFALSPKAIISQFAIWQFITYLFLHGNFFHIFLNMLMLWMFGCEIERVLGSKKFTKFYFITGIGAGLLYVLFNWGSTISVIGASGAVYGVLVAFALFFPNRIITLLLFLILPVHLKAKYLVAIFISISLFSSLQGQIIGVSDGTAHIAHLGGALVAFLMLRGDVLFARILRNIRIHQERKQMRIAKQREEQIRKKKEQVDRILDRINQVGYDAISEEEKLFLKEASEFLSKE
jgi:membrane associated rhomboid family serine protease